jgi:hypothetical protein
VYSTSTTTYFCVKYGTTWCGLLVGLAPRAPSTALAQACSARSIMFGRSDAVSEFDSEFDSSAWSARTARALEEAV